MKYLPELKWVIIVCLAGILIVERACSPTPVPPKPTIITKTDTLYVPKEIPVVIKVPGPTKIVEVQVPVDIDTTAVLKDCYAKKYYKDSVRIDTLGYVVIEDTVSQNRITSRRTYGNYTIPVIKETTTITIPPVYKNQVYIGFSISAPVLSFGPQLTLKTKTDQLYQLGVGLTPYGASISAGMGWKIRLKK